MKKLSRYSIDTARGFSLIELMMSVGIGTILIAGLTAIFALSSRTVKSVDDALVVTDAVSETRLLLTSAQRCTTTLSGKPLTMANPHGVRVDKLIDLQDPKKQRAIIEVGERIEKSREVVTKDIQLVPESALSTTLMVANLEITFGSANANEVDKQIRRTIPIFAKVEKGELKECWARNSQIDAALDRVCVMATEGVASGYDDKKGECKMRNLKWFNGSTTAASCPLGTTLMAGAGDGDCVARQVGAFTDPFVLQRHEGAGGSQIVLGKPPAISILNPQNQSCQCAYDVNIPSSDLSAFVCAIRCEVPETSVAQVQ